jgi:hypothetical protein
VAFCAISNQRCFIPRTSAKSWVTVMAAMSIEHSRQISSGVGSIIHLQLREGFLLKVYPPRDAFGNIPLLEIDACVSSQRMETVGQSQVSLAHVRYEFHDLRRGRN